MAPADTFLRAERAEQFYKDRLQAALEAKQHDGFVAIEVDSGDYFVAPTDREAVAACREAHPDKYPHLIRIGHAAAFFIGGMGW